jgi:hypothetical protein
LRSGLVHFFTRCTLLLANSLRGWMSMALMSLILLGKCVSDQRGLRSLRSWLGVRAPETYTESERQLAQEALAARPGHKPDPGPPGVGPRCTTCTQIPPGCTPRLQWGSVAACCSTAATTAFVRGHRAPVTTNNRRAHQRQVAPPSRSRSRAGINGAAEGAKPRG